MDTISHPDHQCDWNDAKKMYFTLVERGEVWGGAEWVDLREGKFVRVAEDWTNQLYSDVIEYLASDPAPKLGT